MYNKDASSIMSDVRRNKLYYMQCIVNTGDVHVASVDDTELWHKRMAHV